MITNITATVNPPFQADSNETIEARTVSGDYTILECKQTSLNTVQCTVKNCSGRALTVGGSDPFGLAYPPDGHGHRASEFNAQRAQRPDQEDADADADSRHSNPISSDAEVAEESIEEQIIAEHQLFDPSDLDKKFKYTDCEINPNLKPTIRRKLDKILFDNQTVFAKTKLDVGKFPEFTVSLEIDADIPAEKQRFMSEEKFAYCERTFDEFERLGLVQECHSPKTVSNLLLVPKYEGLRDLTKASVYRAQVRGEKNSSFRIVQDLRRITPRRKISKRHLQNSLSSSSKNSRTKWSAVWTPTWLTGTWFSIPNPVPTPLSI